jgi:hypothetical protein
VQYVAILMSTQCFELFFPLPIATAEPEVPQLSKPNIAEHSSQASLRSGSVDPLNAACGKFRVTSAGSTNNNVPTDQIITHIFFASLISPALTTFSLSELPASSLWATVSFFLLWAFATTGFATLLLRCRSLWF